MSPDRLWRWNGQGWIPAAAGPPSSQSHAVGITVGLVAGFLGIILVVVLLVLAILYTMGGQIANVFSNVAAALGP